VRGPIRRRSSGDRLRLTGSAGQQHIGLQPSVNPQEVPVVPVVSHVMKVNMAGRMGSLTPPVAIA
ncbi:hypothetical protein ACFU67_27235, partial [Streptomyces rhizosphaericola]|uniref:hypothetical protein n=1 Tax=Streptomyces rhizosphaericola TaxID=2564098 RepID=UPI003673DCF4